MENEEPCPFPLLSPDALPSWLLSQLSDIIYQSLLLGEVDNKDEWKRAVTFWMVTVLMCTLRYHRATLWSSVSVGSLIDLNVFKVMTLLIYSGESQSLSLPYNGSTFPWNSHYCLSSVGIDGVYSCFLWPLSSLIPVLTTLNFLIPDLVTHPLFACSRCFIGSSWGRVIFIVTGFCVSCVGAFFIVQRFAVQSLRELRVLLSCHMFMMTWGLFLGT